MANVQANLSKSAYQGSLPTPANSDDALSSLSSDQKIMSWLFKLSLGRGLAEQTAPIPAPNLRPTFGAFEKSRQFLMRRISEPMDDWQSVCNITGHSMDDFAAAGVDLPLSAAEIDYFRRNHREMDRLIGRDFLAMRSDLPSPVAELYGLYRHRARLDAEATLFVAQATGSTRVARLMADMLAMGAFANGHECLSYVSMTYAVPAAFDTSALIDRAADEAMRRLAMPIDNPSHLLKMTPDEVSVLASHIVERNVLDAQAFLEKANMLAEARQDTARFATHERLTYAVDEGDLPIEKDWVMRLCEAYTRLMRGWGAPRSMGQQAVLVRLS